MEDDNFCSIQADTQHFANAAPEAPLIRPVLRSTALAFRSRDTLTESPGKLAAGLNSQFICLPSL